MSPRPAPRDSGGRELGDRLAEHLRCAASTSAAVVAGDISAMLWNGVSRMPRLSA